MTVPLTKVSIPSSRYLHSKEGICPQNVDIGIGSQWKAPSIPFSALTGSISLSSFYLKPEDNLSFCSARNSSFSSNPRRPPYGVETYLDLIVFP